ncbi:MAG: PSD1 and planctomycete cytochrome C domain-containing protein [Bryobacterales bacterium]|nr:PSD1 and planctomycete cytochrome C domain-containing protein [Bryobacterales bacterium]
MAPMLAAGGIAVGGEAGSDAPRGAESVLGGISELANRPPDTMIGHAVRARTAAKMERHALAVTFPGLLLLCLAAAQAAFGTDGLPPPVARSVDFSTDIQPLFRERCTMCHGGEQQSSGLRLDREVDALQGGYSGSVIVPGASAESKLIRLVAGVDGDLQMPPVGDRLTPRQIGLLRAWIDQGAVWPASDDGSASDEAEPQARSTHWALQPLARPVPPVTQNREWPRNEIDSFVLAGLDREGVRPSLEADRVTLIRRLSLDLVGLPPTPAEVGAFLEDRRAGAYEEVVGRLLDSKHFGERWARYWLDLAHYADSDGYRGDSFRPKAWRYRHWVIDAINRDMPFDQFTIEQLAGDLLPGATVEQIVATGFLRNTLTNREGGIDPEEFRVEQVVERTSTVGVVWLGLTVGCARCHDHKYDPVSQKEFYQLYSFFNNADEVDIDAPLPGEMGPYLRERAKYLEARQPLLDEHRIPELKRGWEARLLEAAAHPGKWPDWDISFDDLRTYLDHGERILRTNPSDRTWKEEKRFTDYFIRNYDRVLTRERAEELKLKELSEMLKDLDDNFPALSEAPVIESSRANRKTRIHVGGQYKTHGIAVEAGTPAVLPALGIAEPSRLDLARWLVSGENPLPPRVLVNRIWQELFGTGLVGTSENFGVQGERPSHPELLDWLADEFVHSGWSLKRLIKSIVLTATYRQASTARSDLREIDPGNRLLARQSRLRLTAEQIRDSTLHVSGLLYPKIGGKSIRPPQPDGAQRLGGPTWTSSEGKDRYRRGLYVVFQRMSPYPLMSNFDMPSAYGPACRRNRSNTPLQALNLLNDPVFLEAARALAVRVLTESRTSDNAGRLNYAYRLCLGRKPDQEEREHLLSALDRQKSVIEGAPQATRNLAALEIPGVSRVDQAAWVTLCSVLLNADEFITRE